MILSTPPKIKELSPDESRQSIILKLNEVIRGLNTVRRELSIPKTAWEQSMKEIKEGIIKNK